ncbi:MAG: HAD family hydrolase [Thermoguttaceae bacterium]
MPNTYAEILRRHAKEMTPIATDVEPVLRNLPNIRAVLFDVYGTLLISGSGEVGTVGRAACELALNGAFEAIGIAMYAPPAQGIQCLYDAIGASHAASRAAGVEHPEVDIVEIWRTVLAELGHAAVDPARLAVEYEARANPCWPMPQMQKCLEQLNHASLLLGIISNAQFYTPELFVALLEKSTETLGFDPLLAYYSYRHGRAKPGVQMHAQAVESLRIRRIAPDEALYVGNDMLNDILSAHKLGFRTALFAGDRRSLRRRENDPQVAGIVPDLVLTDLAQLPQCIIV